MPPNAMAKGIPRTLLLEIITFKTCHIASTAGARASSDSFSTKVVVLDPSRSRIENETDRCLKEPFKDCEIKAMLECNESCSEAKNKDPWLELKVLVKLLLLRAWALELFSVPASAEESKGVSSFGSGLYLPLTSSCFPLIFTVVSGMSSSIVAKWGSPITTLPDGTLTLAGEVIDNVSISEPPSLSIALCESEQKTERRAVFLLQWGFERVVPLNSNIFHVKTASNWFPLVISYKPEIINTGCSLGAMGCFRSLPVTPVTSTLRSRVESS